MIVQYDGEDFEIEITHFTKGCPAQLYGLPENCYPAEPDEVEYLILTPGLEHYRDDDGLTERILEELAWEDPEEYF